MAAVIDTKAAAQRRADADAAAAAAAAAMAAGAPAPAECEDSSDGVQLLSQDTRAAPHARHEVGASPAQPVDAASRPVVSRTGGSARTRRAAAADSPQPLGKRARAADTNSARVDAPIEPRTSRAAAEPPRAPLQPRADAPPLPPSASNAAALERPAEPPLVRWMAVGADADGAGDLFASARAGAVRKGVSQIDDLGGTPPAVRPSPPREGQRKRRRLQPASTGNSEHYAIEL